MCSACWKRECLPQFLEGISHFRLARRFFLLGGERIPGVAPGPCLMIDVDLQGIAGV